jgi:hypothetical protein
MKPNKTFALIGTVALTAALVTVLRTAPPVARAEEPKATDKTTVTYAKDVAPILYAQCASCHHPGEVAPFSLLSYQDAKKRASQLTAVTQSRFMPPWKADSHGEFLDERRLTDVQIATLKQWAAAGAPEGNPADLPAAPTFTAGWRLGTPDAVYQQPVYSVPAEGADVYQCFVIPTDYKEDRYVSAIEVRPGERAVVHHVIAYLDTTGEARKLDAADPAPGYTSYGGIGVTPSGGLGGWAPGNDARRLDDGVGILLPKGADIVLQVHYHPVGKAEKDQTKLGVYFAKGPVDKRVRIQAVIAPALRVPAGDAHYETGGSQAVPANVTVLGVMPHMHLLGHDMTVAARKPDGTQQPLVSVPDWDFNWQSTYMYKKPIELPQGTRIHLTAHYDNSVDNARNPSDPPKLVTWGEKTTDEMCIAFVFYTVDSEHLTKGIAATDVPDIGVGGKGSKMEKMMMLFDKNGDGKLDDAERTGMVQFLQDMMAKKAAK